MCLDHIVDHQVYFETTSTDLRLYDLQKSVLRAFHCSGLPLPSNVHRQALSDTFIFNRTKDIR